MADVFISYKTERRKAAEHFAEILIHNGYTVWWDHRLKTADDFGPQIDEELASAKAVVVLWCSMSVGKSYVQNEARAAREKLLPVWIEKVELPSEFNGKPTLDLSEWDGAPRSATLDDFFVRLERLVGRPPDPDAKELREYESRWRRFGAPPLAALALGAGVGSLAQKHGGAGSGSGGSQPDSSLHQLLAGVVIVLVLIGLLIAWNFDLLGPGRRITVADPNVKARENCDFRAKAAEDQDPSHPNKDRGYTLTDLTILRSDGLEPLVADCRRASEAFPDEQRLRLQLARLLKARWDADPNRTQQEELKEARRLARRAFDAGYPAAAFTLVSLLVDRVGQGASNEATLLADEREAWSLLTTALQQSRSNEWPVAVASENCQQIYEGRFDRAEPDQEKRFALGKSMCEAAADRSDSRALAIKSLATFYGRLGYPKDLVRSKELAIAAAGSGRLDEPVALGILGWWKVWRPQEFLSPDEVGEPLPKIREGVAHLVRADELARIANPRSPKAIHANNICDIYFDAFENSHKGIRNRPENPTILQEALGLKLERAVQFCSWAADTALTSRDSADTGVSGVFYRGFFRLFDPFKQGSRDYVRSISDFTRYIEIRQKEKSEFMLQGLYLRGLAKVMFAMDCVEDAVKRPICNNVGNLRQRLNDGILDLTSVIKIAAKNGGKFASHPAVSNAIGTLVLVWSSEQGPEADQVVPVQFASLLLDIQNVFIAAGGKEKFLGPLSGLMCTAGSAALLDQNVKTDEATTELTAKGCSDTFAWQKETPRGPYGSVLTIWGQLVAKARESSGQRLSRIKAHHGDVLDILRHAAAASYLGYRGIGSKFALNTIAALSDGANKDFAYLQPSGIVFPTLWRVVTQSGDALDATAQLDQLSHKGIGCPQAMTQFEQALKRDIQRSGLNPTAHRNLDKFAENVMSRLADCPGFPLVILGPPEAGDLLRSFEDKLEEARRTVPALRQSPRLVRSPRVKFEEGSARSTQISFILEKSRTTPISIWEPR